MDNNNGANAGEKNKFPGKKDTRTLMGVLAYLGPFIIISYAMSKDDPFVKFHIKQGLVLVVISVIIWVLTPMFWSLWMFLRIVNFVVFILAILGIINVLQGKEKPLPLVGQFSHYFSF